MSDNDDRLRQEFELFDRTNPAVWELFLHYTRWLVDRGHGHYSADAVLHRVRWATNVETLNAGVADGQPLKINNNFAAFYARKWAASNPQYRDFFRMRRSAADQEAIQLTA
jgi:hypothetical protein